MSKQPIRPLIFVLAIATNFAHTAQANSPKSGRTYTSDLAQFTGQTFTLSGGGTATVDDFSAAISNPAGLAIQKQFSGSGSITWQGENIRTGQAAVHDSTLSEIAAALNYQTTTAITGGKDKRFSLGIAERLPDTKLTLGVAGDYSQLEASKLPEYEGKKVDVIRLRFGALYTINETIQIGASSDGYFDKMRDKRHQLGIGIGAAKYYLFSGDIVFKNTTLAQYIGGFTVSVQEFFELSGSYGYNLSPSDHFFAAGASVKSQQMKISYTIARPSIKEDDLQHQALASIILSL